MNDEFKPRLRLATDDELPEKYRQRTDNFTRVFGHHTELFERWNAWYRPLIGDLALPSRLKEMVRFRVAQLNECEF